jgi:hypothetical protein
MSIFGTIIDIVEKKDNTEILIESKDGDRIWTYKMFILHPTVKPCIDDEIWGGSDSVMIESNCYSFPYIRTKYRNLIQDW